MTLGSARVRARTLARHLISGATNRHATPYRRVVSAWLARCHQPRIRCSRLSGMRRELLPLAGCLSATAVYHETEGDGADPSPEGRGLRAREW